MDFIFLAKVVLDLVSVVRAKINTSCNVSNKNRVSSFDDFALHFEADVGINVVNDPDSLSIWTSSVEESNLLGRELGAHSWCLLGTCKLQRLSEEMFVGLNSKFLSISNVLIRGEHVNSVLLQQLEDRSGHWAWILTSTCASNGVSLLEIWNSLTNVHDEPTLSLCVLDHDLVSPLKATIGCMRPGHLSVALLILAYRLCERKRTVLLLRLVVVGLNGVELKVFIPVSDSGFVGVFGASLQLLGGVLHIFCKL